MSCVSAPTPLAVAHHFANLPDPRHRAFREHHLLGDILVIGLAGVLSGANSWDAIAEFGASKEGWLRSIGLTLPNGIPSHDTFSRLFARLDPAQFLELSDTLDAITTNRPYQSAREIDTALEVIRKAAGSKFDPNVVGALEAVVQSGKLHLAPTLVEV